MYVVVKSAVFKPVFLEQPVGVLVSKIFKLYQGVLTPAPFDGLHELVDELIVQLTAHSLVFEANIQRVIQQFLKQYEMAANKTVGELTPPTIGASWCDASWCPVTVSSTAWDDTNDSK